MTAQLLIPQGGATVDSNGRRKLCPMYTNIRAAERDFPWARALVGYIRSPNKNKKPANISQVGWLCQKRATCTRQVHRQLEAHGYADVLHLVRWLRHLRSLSWQTIIGELTRVIFPTCL